MGRGSQTSLAASSDRTARRFRWGELPEEGPRPTTGRAPRFRARTVSHNNKKVAPTPELVRAFDGDVETVYDADYRKPEPVKDLRGASVSSSVGSSVAASAAGSAGAAGGGAAGGAASGQASCPPARGTAPMWRASARPARRGRWPRTRRAMAGGHTMSRPSSVQTHASPSATSINWGDA